MTVSTVIIVLLALVGGSTALGVVLRSRQGRVARSAGSAALRPGDLPGVERFAPGATLLQFSTEVCAPCAATSVLLGEVASAHPGVSHIDLDVTNRPELASRFHILQTPTTLILDARGVVRARIGGAPRRDTLTAELTRILVTA